MFGVLRGQWHEIRMSWKWYGIGKIGHWISIANCYPKFSWGKIREAYITYFMFLSGILQKKCFLVFINYLYFFISFCLKEFVWKVICLVFLSDILRGFSYFTPRKFQKTVGYGLCLEFKQKTKVLLYSTQFQQLYCENFSWKILKLLHTIE